MRIIFYTERKTIMHIIVTILLTSLLMMRSFEKSFAGEYGPIRWSANAALSSPARRFRWEFNPKKTHQFNIYITVKTCRFYKRPLSVLFVPFRSVPGGTFVFPYCFRALYTYTSRYLLVGVVRFYKAHALVMASLETMPPPSNRINNSAGRARLSRATCQYDIIRYYNTHRSSALSVSIPLTVVGTRPK